MVSIPAHKLHISMKKWIYGLLGTGLVITALAFSQPSNKYFEIIKNLELFSNVYKELNAGYVDELDPAATMRKGLDAMLGSLDPYTNFISESEMEGYRTLSEGRYRGIGAQVKKIGEYVTITQIYEDSPALKAGLKPGDLIVEVDGQDARNRSTEDLNLIMQGTPGTALRLKVERPGEKKPFLLNLTREEVNIPNVPHTGMVDENIGYISLTTFTQMAGSNIQSAIRDLKAKNPNLNGLILDLRDNGGGLLNEAVNICNLFIPKNELVVSTRSKLPEQDRTYKTTSQPEDLEIPLVVLVNNRSASASEIVSGTIQDLDRGVVMGQLTFGKGLVQNTKEIGYNARLKLTTAKYYIPSGRCIQAVRYDEKGIPVHIPDAEREKFKTRNGRVVLDGGGVMPDVELAKPRPPAIIQALLDQDLIFHYGTNYALKYDSIASPDDFRFQDWDGFKSFLAERKFEFKTRSDIALDSLKVKAQEEEINALLTAEIKGIEDRLLKHRMQALEANKSEIIHLLEMDIIGRYHYEKGRKQLNLRKDPEVEAAIALIKDPVRYKRILTKN
jgi:carboxyl-terminal processing protease